MNALDTNHCPLCGTSNDCGIAKGAGTCWCFLEQVPEAVLERVPAEARDRVCVCRACATGRRDPLDRILRLPKASRNP